MSIRTDHLHADLPRRSVRSGAVVLVAQAATIGIGIGSVAILGRLLTPEDFGVVAIAASFVAFITTFADHGLPQSIVQREDVTDAQVSSMFWLNCAGGVLAALLGTAIAWPVSAWFDRPELFGIISALSGTLVITGIGAPQLALLRRQLRFRAHATIGVLANALGVIAAVIAALLGWGYWSLVVLTVGMTTARTIGGWACSSWRPSRPALAPGIGPMVRFGVYLSGTSLVGVLARTTDRLLIGYGLGAAAAGFYANGARLILIPARQINTPLTSVAIPVLSRIQDDPERFREFYRRGVEVIVLALCPFILVAMVAAGHIVPLFLGDQWSDSVPIFRAMAPAALIACTQVVTSWVYVPLGRTDRQFRWQIFRAILTVAAFVVGLRWGAVGVAAAYSVLAVSIRLPAVLYAIHGTFVRLGDVVSATWRIGVAAAIAVAVGWPAASTMRSSGGHFVACVLITLVVFASYGVAFALTPGGWRRLAAMRSVVRHLGSGRGPNDGNEPGETGHAATPALRRRRQVHVLHVSKTGGTAVKAALAGHLQTPEFVIRPHEHRIRLRDVPAGDGFVFMVRDPLSRFVSAFNSRLRQGKPRYDIPWNDEERVAFATFRTPDALARGLASTDDAERTAAETAMTSIRQVRTRYWDWFEDEAYFRSRADDLLFVGHQESLDDDFERLRVMLGLPDTVALPQEDLEAHRAPEEMDRHLSEVAVSALRRWYASDYAFLDVCADLVGEVRGRSPEA